MMKLDVIFVTLVFVTTVQCFWEELIARDPSHEGHHDDNSCDKIMGILRKNNLCLAGMKSYYIKDLQISASGTFRNLESHGPQHARLDSNTGVGGWAAATDNEAVYQWIQVDLYKPKQIFGVMIQGRSQIQQWVQKFKVQYGMNPYAKKKDDMMYVTKYRKGKGTPMVFNGATDPNTKHSRRFPQPITARVFRIVPTKSYVYPCLRFDLLEC